MYNKFNKHKLAVLLPKRITKERITYMQQSRQRNNHEDVMLISSKI